MNPARLELALKKQRLQLRSAALRAELVADIRPVVPVLTAADRVGDGVRWLKGHPELVVGAAVAVAVARPRVALRWARRGLYAWQTVRKLRDWIGDKKKPA